MAVTQKRQGETHRRQGYQLDNDSDSDLLDDVEVDLLRDIGRQAMLEGGGESRDRDPALLLSVEDAARLLGVGRTTLFALIADGRIQTVRLGRRRLVVRSGLERFVEEICSY